MLLVIFLGFGGIMFWAATRFPQSFEGSVKGNGLTLVPFGCSSARAANTLTIPLRPDPSPEGLNEENRAIIISDNSQEGTTTKPRAVQVSSIAWRNEAQELTTMECRDITSDMTVFSKRRNGKRIIREDLWNGTIKATCTAPVIGEINIDLDLKNCD